MSPVRRLHVAILAGRYRTDLDHLADVIEMRRVAPAVWIPEPPEAPLPTNWGPRAFREDFPRLAKGILYGLIGLTGFMLGKLVR